LNRSRKLSLDKAVIMSLLALLGIGIVLGILGVVVLYARWNYGVLEKLNIPVVRLSFILGSTPNLHNDIQHFEDIKRFQKYGPIFGVP